MSHPAIEVKELGKKFDLGAINASTLREQLGETMRKWAGKGTPPEQDEFWALRDVSFDVQPGEVVGIIGRNGAGKSTLLKILSRITPPTVGDAIVRGRLASLLEVGTGFHPELTGRENVFLNGSILGMKRQEVKGLFDEIVEFAGIEKFVDTPVKRYSSGMYVRLAFAVAAHIQPEILVIDEVLAVGDYEFQKKCLGKMGEIATQGRTVLFVSHNMGAITELCSRVIVIDQGQVSFDGDKNKAVSLYLSGRQNESYMKLSDENVPGFSNIPNRVMETWIEHRDGDKNATFQLDEPIVVRMRYLLQENMADARISLVVYRNGRSVFTSFSTDQSITHERLGEHEIRFEIDPMFLKAGSYMAEVFVSPPVFKVPNALNFTVEGTTMNTHNKGFREDRVGNVIAQGQWKQTP